MDPKRVLLTSLKQLPETGTRLDGFVQALIATNQDKAAKCVTDARQRIREIRDKQKEHVQLLEGIKTNLELKRNLSTSSEMPVDTAPKYNSLLNYQLTINFNLKLLSYNLKNDFKI